MSLAPLCRNANSLLLTRWRALVLALRRRAVLVAWRWASLLLRGVFGLQLLAAMRILRAPVGVVHLLNLFGGQRMRRVIGALLPVAGRRLLPRRRSILIVRGRAIIPTWRRRRAIVCRRRRTVAGPVGAMGIIHTRRQRSGQSRECETSQHKLHPNTHENVLPLQRQFTTYRSC